MKKVKIKRKVISTLLLLTFAFTMNGTALAAQEANNEINSDNNIEITTIETDENNGVYEEVFSLGDVCYYRLIDDEKTIVISENDNYREIAINFKNEPDIVHYNMMDISNVQVLNEEAATNSLDYFRNMSSSYLAQAAQFEVQEFPAVSSSIAREATDPAIVSKVHDTLRSIGEPQAYNNKWIYSKADGGKTAVVYETMTYDMSNNVTRYFSAGTTLSVILSIFTLSSDMLIRILTFGVNAQGVYELVSGQSAAEYNVFQRTVRDAKVSNVTTYSATRTRKWIAGIGISNNIYTVQLDDAYTHYTSDLYNDLSAMCLRAIQYS